MKMYHFTHLQINTEQAGVAVTLWTYIRDVPGSNLGWETGYLDCGFSLLSSVPPGKCWDGTFKQATIAAFQILSNSSFIEHPIL
jgi:hypothetical protein